MTDRLDPATTILLDPADTVRVWQERGVLQPTVNWAEMMHEEHASAFTVAKIARLDLLAAVRESLDPVIRGGGTFEQWKASILPELQKAGWWGVVQDPALTGSSDTIVVNDRRLRTIFDTNLRMSIAAGRWRRYQREKEVFPYLRYLSHHYRKHPREDHYSWHGLILPIDDPAWQWMFPPNGWGCHCQVVQVSEAGLKRNGWSVGTAPNPPQRAFVRPDGSVVHVPEGIEPGFSYNPGTAHLRVLAERLTGSIERALVAGLEDEAQSALRALIADPALDQFIAAPEARVPLAILTPARAAQLGVTTRVATLSAETQGKQLDRAAEGDLARLLASTYRPIPDLFDNPRWLARDTPGSYLLVGERPDGRYLCVVAKPTVSGKGLFIKSARVQNVDGTRRFLAGADILEGGDGP